MANLAHRLKCLLLILAFLVFKIAAFSQVGVMPTDDFYYDAVGWELKRYTKDLPVTKPYPLNTIKRILQDVLNDGDDRAKSRAQYYMDKYFPQRLPLHVLNDFSVNIRVKKVDSGGDDNTKIYEHKEIYNGKLAFAADWIANSFMSLSCDLGLIVRSNDITKLDALPRFVVNNDTDVILPLKKNGGDVDFLLNPNIIFSWGNERMYGTVGVNRTGYGLFFDDSVIMNPFAYQSINASFNYNCSVFSYSQMFGALAATKNGNTDDFRLGKFMGFHTTEFHLPSRWSISLYESIIFRKPFNPVYLLPLPWFIVSNVSGFNDNVMSGINFSWKPGCVALSVDLLLDDFKPTKLLKLKINDSAMRTALKLGFVYSPPESPCEFISVNYTLITPYTYTKYSNQNKSYNYLDYTNFGQSMGSSLPPNSDSIGMTISWRMFRHFRLKTSTSFSRHGNPYQDMDESDVVDMSRKHYNSEGLINSDTRGCSSAEDVTGFLKQHDIMYIMQASLYAEWEQVFHRKDNKASAGNLTVQFQYTFEYINKDGVDSPMFHGRYNNEDEVSNARTRWQNALHDSYNHYFTVGLKYFF